MIKKTSTKRLESKPIARKDILIRKTSKLSSQGKNGASRRTLKPKNKAWKFVKTHLAECDDAFAREIRERDGQCLFPGCGTTKNLTCSHYIGRGNWNTRFDDDNCITLCQTHHFWDKMIGWEFQKQRIGVKGCDWNGRYTVFMMEYLGTERWEALLTRAAGDKSRKEAILEAQKRYNLRQPIEDGDNSLSPAKPM